MLPTFIETPLFTRQVKGELTAEEYAAFQWHLSVRPETGDLIPGSGGLRKVRWRAGGRGKRGGVRVIYFWRSAAGEIWLLYLYAKSSRSDLSASQLVRLRRDIDSEL